MFKRFIAFFVCFSFILSSFQYGFAQNFSIDQLPVPGSMISTTAPFVPLTLKGLVIHPENALKFDFLMDTGHSRLKGQALSDEALKIMKYFLTALTIPEEDLWVNLSPYEKGRIIQSNFGQTIMGRDLLAQDYILKQLTSSLIYPEKALGKEFWQQIYSKAAKEYGTTEIPVNTFNKVWIVPSEAVVWEHEGKVLIVKSHLKVMLEEDYLSLSKHQTLPATSTLGSQIVRKIVLPVLEKEVNEGQNFAQLRQMFQAMILSTWYKKALKESILNKVYSNRNKTLGVDGIKAGDVESIYRQYLKAFKKGAFNYIKEDIDPATGQTIPRKYFSGGFGEQGLAGLSKEFNGAIGSLPNDQRSAVINGIGSTGNTISVAGKFNDADTAMIAIEILKSKLAHIAVVKVLIGTPDPSLWLKLLNHDNEYTRRSAMEEFDKRITNDQERLTIFTGVLKAGNPRLDANLWAVAALKSMTTSSVEARELLLAASKGPFGLIVQEMLINFSTPAADSSAPQNLSQMIPETPYQAVVPTPKNLDKQHNTDLWRIISKELDKNYPNWELLSRIYEALAGDEVFKERLKEYQGSGKEQQIINEIKNTQNDIEEPFLTNLTQQAKMCFLGDRLYYIRKIDGLNNAAPEQLVIIPSKDFDMAMLGLKLWKTTDWRTDKDSVEKHFSKLDVPQTLDELGKYGSVTKQVLSDDYRLHDVNAIWAALNDQDTGYIGADGAFNDRFDQLTSPSDMVLPETLNDQKTDIYNILQQSRYSDFFYKAGSDRIDELYNLGKINEQIIIEYFSPKNNLPAKYRGVPARNIPSIYRDPFPAISDKLNDPKYPDSFKKLCVDILKKHTGTLLIHQVAPIVRSYGWGEEVLPEWLWYALSPFTKASDTDAMNNLRDYILKRKARRILQGNDVNEIIKNLTQDIVPDDLQVDEFISLYKIKPLLAVLGLSDNFSDIESALQALRNSIKPFQIFIKDLKTHKVPIERSLLWKISSIIQDSPLDPNLPNSVWNFYGNSRDLMSLREDISGKDEERVAGFIKKLSVEDRTTPIDLGSFRSSDPTGYFLRKLEEAGVLKIDFSREQVHLIVDLPQNEGKIKKIAGEVIWKILQESQSQTIERIWQRAHEIDQRRIDPGIQMLLPAGFINFTDDQLVDYLKSPNGKKLQRKLLKNLFPLEAPSTAGFRDILKAGIDQLADQEKKLTLLEEVLKDPSNCAWAMDRIDHTPGITAERKQSIFDRIRHQENLQGSKIKYPDEVVLWGIRSSTHGISPLMAQMTPVGSSLLPASLNTTADLPQSNPKEEKIIIRSVREKIAQLTRNQALTKDPGLFDKIEDYLITESMAPGRSMDFYNDCQSIIDERFPVTADRVQNYITLLNRLTWRNEDTPEWVWRALGRYMFNMKALQTVVDYFVKRQAKEILHRFLDDANNNTDEIIENMNKTNANDIEEIMDNLRNKGIEVKLDFKHFGNNEEMGVDRLTGEFIQFTHLRYALQEGIIEFVPDRQKKLLILDKLSEDENSDMSRWARIKRSEINSDKAALAKNPGGIALNPKLLDLQIKRDSNGVPLALREQSLDKINIQGFVPQIISIQPVDLPALFGLNS